MVRKIKEKWVDFSTLPLKDGHVDWDNSIGCKCKFKYEEIVGELTIVNTFFETIEGKKNRRKLHIKYKEFEMDISPGNLKKGQLGTFLKDRTSEFKINIGDVFKDKKRNIEILDLIHKIDDNNTHRKICKYKCNNCNYIGETFEHIILDGCGCSCCSSRKVVKDINSIWKTHNEFVKYFKHIEDSYTVTYGSNKALEFRCPICGYEKNMKVSTLTREGFSCPRCSDGISYPNKFIYGLLDELNIKYETEYSPNWAIDCNGSRRYYDVKINEKGMDNIIIEMDGGLGHGKKIHGKSNLTGEETKFIDDEKDRMAKENGFTLIRVDCDYNSKTNHRFEIIKNNAILKLNTILDLTNVDWNKVAINANRNLMLEACQIKKENPSMSAMDISKILNISPTSSMEYLKEGTKLNLCNYNAKEHCTKPMEVLRSSDGTCIGVFESIGELSNASLELYGRQLTKKEIFNRVNKKVKNDELGIIINNITYQEYLGKKDLTYPKHTIYYKGIKVSKENEFVGIFKSQNDIISYVRIYLKEILLPKDIKKSLETNMSCKGYTFEKVNLNYNEYKNLTI